MVKLKIISKQQEQIDEISLSDIFKKKSAKERAGEGVGTSQTNAVRSDSGAL